MGSVPPPPFTARIVEGVRDIPRASWEAMFPGDPEDWDYYVACEGQPPPAFRFGAVVVERNGEAIAAAPTFRLIYRLDTPLQGRWRPVGDWLGRILPRLVSLPVLGLGSPLADRCHLGFDPGLSHSERIRAASALLQCLDEHAAEEGIPILAVKDLADESLRTVDAALGAQKFARLAGLPVAVLDLPFANEDEYLASLSASTRKDIRRKLKSAKQMRTEMRTSIAGLEDEIVSLYDETRRQSGVDYGDFEMLSPGYFRDVMGNPPLGTRAAIDASRVVMLYWLGERLIGFNLLLVGRDRVIDKFIGMRYPAARELNLYAVSWMTNVRFCLERGIKTFQTGQTAYSSKVRYGSHLEKSWIYFKHRTRPVNAIFRTVGPWLSFDKMDPELAALRKAGKVS